MIPSLIGIAGKAGAGKDTLADILVSMRGATKYNFALPIKQALNAMFCWDMRDWDDRVWKEKVIPWIGKSPRQCAQTLGTEWGRDLVNPRLWTLIAMQRYDTRKMVHLPFVIPDLRFDNEADEIHSRGGIVLNIRRLSAEPINAHKSEEALSDGNIDYTLYNELGVRDLQEMGLNVLDAWTEYA